MLFTHLLMVAPRHLVRVLWKMLTENRDYEIRS